MANFKFQIGNQVVITMKDGSTVNGKVKSFEVNPFNYKKEYDVTYFDTERNREMRMMGVPEPAMALA
jgi:small nuclear ribonucleoprotein (snRNP)-like protein